MTPDFTLIWPLSCLKDREWVRALRGKGPRGEVRALRAHGVRVARGRCVI